jgi:RNA:NAD 2'-phosphotransferase (TPT1/KptA family)
LELAKRIVAECEKQRFTLEEDDDDGECYIRANQGHSLSRVKSGELLTPITADQTDQFPIVAHGTYKK